MLLQIPFKKLASDPENARKTLPSPEGIKSLALSIQEFGLLQPLLVRAFDQTLSRDDEQEGYYVTAGSRRLLAIGLLVAQGVYEEDSLIECTEFDGTDHIREVSAVENNEREAMHPVDTFEMYAEAILDEDSEEAIARRHGVTTRYVRQMVALGNLHPNIRQAWRDGILEEDAARAFTIIDSLDQQLEVFESLEAKGTIYVHSIQAAIGANYEAKDALAVVGVEAYKEAGGYAAEDLFDGPPIVSDMELLRKMAADKVDATCRDLLEEGWSFAVSQTEAKAHNYWAWASVPVDPVYTEEETRALGVAKAVVIRLEDLEELTDEEESELESRRLEIEEIEHAGFLSGITSDHKAVSGCVVGMDDSGLTIDYGKIWHKQAPQPPQEAQTAAPPPVATGDDGQAFISARTTLLVTGMLTVAAARTLEASPELAVQALTLHLEGFTKGSPFRLSAMGLFEAIAPRVRDGDFADGIRATAMTAALDEGDPLLLRFATAAAATLNMQTQHVLWIPDGHKALIAAMPAWGFMEHASAIFKDGAREYFETLTSSQLKDALLEMGMKRPMGNKAGLIKQALDDFQESNWLPAELRHPKAFTPEAPTEEEKPEAAAKPKKKTTTAKARKGNKPRTKR